MRRDITIARKRLHQNASKSKEKAHARDIINGIKCLVKNKFCINNGNGIKDRYNRIQIYLDQSVYTFPIDVQIFTNYLKFGHDNAY